MKDWLKQSGFKWKNGKQTRQALIPVSGGRPRMWLLEDSNYLRELSETALGSAPQLTINEYEEIKLNNALNNFSYGKTTKREVIIRFLKRVFGPKWTT